jgi:hypothetical protein
MKCTLFALLFGAILIPIKAAEAPYFVTYTHQLEEQGNLEMAARGATAKPVGSNRFLGTVLEIEYGLFGWWTTEVYLDGQVTGKESTVFTGYRWENRFRLTKEEHRINPVLYFEFENINAADKSLLEVVGHDGEHDLAEPNDSSRREKKREIEAKLLLGSNWRGWNFSENLIFEKNVAHQPWEFGYAIGVSRPLSLAARSDNCNFCLENFNAGLEAYGGLGDTRDLTLSDTSHYIAPSLGWTSASGVGIKISPSFGMTASSIPLVWRFGVSYEFAQFARRRHAQ